MDAAASLFIERGYDQTSLAAIVKNSGGSLATLYELFGNKQGLLRAICEHWRQQEDCEVACFEGQPRQILSGYAHRKQDQMSSPRVVALIRMAVTEAMRDPVFAASLHHDLHVPAIEELTDLFQAWNSEGKAKIDDPAAAAELFSLIVGGDSLLRALTGFGSARDHATELDWRLDYFFDRFAIV